MKTVIKRQFELLALLLMAAPLWGMTASAAQFEQAEISNPENFVIVAAPAGRVGYGLLILEQVKNDRPCWDEVETGGGLTIVDPLLTRFDFTGICGRSNDSNSYSLRAGGEDLGLQYSLRVLRQGNNLFLVAASNRQRNLNIPIGRTNGLPQPGAFAEIQLEPGWRLARRTFNGRSTGHVYLTNDQPISVLVAAATSPTSTAGPISLPPRPNPQVPSNSPLLPPPGSTSSLTEAPPPRDTAQPGTPAPIQIPVPPPESPRANSGNASGANPGSASAARPGTNPGANSGSASVTRPGNSPGTSSGTGSGTGSGTNPPPVTPSRAPLPPLPNRPAAGAPAVPPPPAPPASTTATRTLPLPVPPAPPTTGTTPPPPSATPPAQSIPVPPPEQRQATGIVYGYRVIVAADSAELQDRVRSLAPQTQIVTINGQPAVQAGLFRDLNSAEQLRQRLAGENLSVTIVPIR